MSRVDRDGKRAHERSQMELGQVAEILRENQKLITLGRLTASIAHEINNPLESITNLLYLMEQESTQKAAEYLKLAQRELNRVVQITRQTLTFSRETNVPMRVQLSELLDEVLDLYRRRILDKRLRVVRQYQAHEPVLILPGEMRQVLSNLFSNAVEATELRGRIVVRLSPARRWSGQGSRGVRLSLGDNGSGIPSEIRSRLGEPFFTTKGQAGTGLGLWVTQSILNRYGGSLQMRSSISPARHGTVFSIFLPVIQRSLAVVPGGGEAENLPRTGTRGSRWSGLRLIQTEDPAGQASTSPENNVTPIDDVSVDNQTQVLRMRAGCG